ncbi:uncharacterized protein Cpr73D isoform X2 [Hetaerina americana]|uniref:uncharacterized protein Cpr73D isoform X2 n=1 Tax=Hetaerina americana TaxID=62018 RepID=UPI003A7F1EF4
MQISSLALVLLASAVAVSAWEPPKLPAGRRIQYYIQHPQGDYVFGYDTGEGSSHAARSDPSNRVRGNFQYGGVKSPGSFAYSYSGGYVVPGAEVKNAGLQTAGYNYNSESSPTVTTYESGTSDASYNFAFDAGDHSRQESSDAVGNVVGSYAFTAKDGINRKVDYEAGAGKGFIAQGAHLPVAPQQGADPAAPVSAKAVPSVSAISYSAPPSNADGSYSFSYDAGDHLRSESSDAAGNVRGHFAFVAKDGVQRKVDYDAGAEKGFIAKGDHLPAAPTPLVPATPVLPTFKYDSPKLVLPSAQAQIDTSANQDGSYSFAYDAGDHSRKESADAAGNVRGQFSFVAKDGVNRKVDYEASREGGFLAKGAHLPVALDHPAQVPISYQSPPVTLQFSSKPDDTPVDGSYSFSYDAGDHFREESADATGNVKGKFAFVAKDGILRKVNYEAGAEKGFLATGDHLPSSPESLDLKKTIPFQPSFPAIASPTPIANPNPSTKFADISSSAAPDGSYSFSYVADDHTREESADSFGNVRGRFAFTATDGVNRKVDYEAGAEKGFIAKGAHLPVAPEVPVSAAVPAFTPNSYSHSIEAAGTPTSDSSDSSPVDGSYSFSYNAGDHAREESADAAGNVRGRFSFVAKDGINRKVEYEAGAEKGFVAKGDHIPQTDAIELKKIPTSPVKRPVSFVTGTHAAPITAQFPVKTSSTPHASSGDRSYSFSYEAADHSRQESADADGNVKGQFAFIAKDGINRNVEYTAGAERGFEAKGSHLPVAPEVPVISANPTFTPLSNPAFKPVIPLSSPSAFESSPVDGSYSFSYNADDHSRHESADSSGNVKGSFSFRAKDGVDRKVNYEAGAERGFVAQGDHLPSDANFNQRAGVETSAHIPIIPHTQPVGPSSFSTPVVSSGPLDASYTFFYNAPDHSRAESADAAGNVRGKFSFVANDGINRNVDYEAGAEKGFLAKGSHLPLPALVGGSDGLSYHYSYETDSSKKAESSDGNGFVTGSFSYLGADGLTRKVDYRAGGEEGFVASGDHLQPATGVAVNPTSSVSLKAINSPPSKSAFSYSSSTGASSAYSSLTAKTKPLSSAPYSVRTFLPHESPSKFGYIYDSLA